MTKEREVGVARVSYKGNVASRWVSAVMVGASNKNRSARGDQVSNYGNLIIQLCKFNPPPEPRRRKNSYNEYYSLLELEDIIITIRYNDIFSPTKFENTNVTLIRKYRLILLIKNFYSNITYVLSCKNTKLGIFEFSVEKKIALNNSVRKILSYEI